MTEAKTTTVASAKRKGNRALLAGTAAFLVIGAVTAHAASSATDVNKKRTVSSLMSAALAALMVNKTPAPTPAPAPAPTPTPAASVPATQLGINLTTIAYWSNDRAFANLIHGSAWTISEPGRGWQDLDPARGLQDANGWVKEIPAGAEIIRALSQPIIGPDGVRIRCTYDGSGDITVGNVKNLQSAPGRLTFTMTARFPHRENVWLSIRRIDPGNYIRNIDCREEALPASVTYSPEFVATLRNYKVIRFMDWQNTNANSQVDWSTRNSPQGALYLGKDGIPVEKMLELVSLTNADPWFNMSWNASDEYVRQFAVKVRDTLPRDRKAYIETSNEVWNGAFPIASQAQREGLARGLASNPTEAQMLRYSQRSVEVFRIWTDVFAGQLDRIVRVVNTQNANPWTTGIVMQPVAARQYFDAVATAPYFGYEVSSNTGILDTAFSVLGGSVAAAISDARQHKTAAASFGKRYIAYEAGQHIVINNNIPFLTNLNRDERMYNLYRDYIQAWRSQIGDVMVMFSNVGPVTQYGAWGLQEYVGQPLAETPKRRAILDAQLN